MRARDRLSYFKMMLSAGFRRTCLPVCGFVFYLLFLPTLALNKNMTLLSNPPGGTRGGWGYTDSLGQEFALVCRGSALYVWDISEPVNPILACSVARAVGASDLKQVRTHQHWAYAVNQTGGPSRAALQIVDLTDPYNATTVGQYPGSLSANVSAPNGAHTVHIDGAYAYLGMNGAHSDWWVVSLANPVAPVQASHASPGPGSGTMQSHDSYLKGDTAYVAFLGSGFSVFDVSDRAAPVRLKDVLYPDAFTHNTWTTEDGKFLFTTDEVAGGYLRVWDIRRLSDIQQVAGYDVFPGIVHNVFVRGNFAYLSCYTEGVKILDIEDPTYPVEVGSYDTYPQGSGVFLDGCWDVYPYFDSGLVTAYDMANGLFVLSFNGARAGRIYGRITDAVSGRPLPKAEVRLLDVDKAVTTDELGRFSLRTGDGYRPVEVSRFGFATDTFWINGILSDSVELAASLTPLPEGTLTGTVAVLGLVSSPPTFLSGIRIGVDGDDFFADTTDAAGSFSLNLPAGIPLLLRAGRWGMVTQTDSIYLQEGQTLVRDYQFFPGYSDPFEFEQGWGQSDSSDDAAAGHWENTLPMAAYNDTGFQTQPGSDHTPDPGGHCFLTGQARTNQTFREHDVDGGKTTLLSPVMDLSNYLNPVLSYWRWFTNSGTSGPGQDTLAVEISNDGGSTWVALEKTRVGQSGWVFRQFNLSGIITLGGNMRFRIVVFDRGEDSNVEAALDDFAVSGAPIRGDLNRDGLIGPADVVVLLNAIFLGSPLLSPSEADFNADCVVGPSDVVLLLKHVFAGDPLGSACSNP